MPASVLVVEDETSAAESIRDALVAAGFTVPETVASGARALEAATRLRPALVLMDVQLDGPMDGIETAALLRARMDVPVVYLTSFVDQETLARAKATAPHGYLRKPFGPRELTIAVELALHQHSLERIAAAREELFATTLYSIADAVLTVDEGEKVSFVNGAAERLLGRDRSALTGATVADALRLVDGHGTSLAPLVSRALQQRSATTLPRDARLVTASGTSRDVEGSIAPMLSNERGATGAVVVLRDVGERRRLERRLLATERLAAVGTMAAGMRHEINNPLSFVLANVGHALATLREQQTRGAPVDPEVLAALEDAAHGAERVRHIVDVLRPFAQGPHADEGRREPLATRALVDDAVRASSHALRHHARLVVDDAEGPLVCVDREQMTAAVVALLLGAAGRVGEGRAAEATIALACGADAEGRAFLEVRDDGPPLGEAELARMFDPFAASGNATAGVELAIAQRTILAHGGEIDVQSHAGRGTTMRVTLPVHRGRIANARPKETPRPREETATPEARPRVLVVDDEPAIGRALGRILGPGHDVVVENDARAALARVAQGEEFDVVLCDLMMPLMSGMDFFEQLASKAAALRERVVFLTGGAFTPRSEQFLREVSNTCLAKPFSRTAVLDAVRQVVGSREGGAATASPPLDTPPAPSGDAS